MVGKKKLVSKNFHVQGKDWEEVILGMIKPTWITCEEPHVRQILKTNTFQKPYTTQKSSRILNN